MPTVRRFPGFTPAAKNVGSGLAGGKAGSVFTAFSSKTPVASAFHPSAKAAKRAGASALRLNPTPRQVRPAGPTSSRMSRVGVEAWLRTRRQPVPAGFV